MFIYIYIRITILIPRVFSTPQKGYEKNVANMSTFQLLLKNTAPFANRHPSFF